MEPDQSGITAMCRTMTKTQCRSLFREIDQCRKAVGRINAKDWMQIWQSSGLKDAGFSWIQMRQKFYKLKQLHNVTTLQEYENFVCNKPTCGGRKQVSKLRLSQTSDPTPHQAMNIVKRSPTVYPLELSDTERAIVKNLQDVSKVVCGPVMYSIELWSYLGASRHVSYARFRSLAVHLMYDHVATLLQDTIPPITEDTANSIVISMSKLTKKFGVEFDPNLTGYLNKKETSRNSEKTTTSGNELVVVSSSSPLIESSGVTSSKASFHQRRLSDGQWIKVLLTDCKSNRLIEKSPRDWKQLVCRLGLRTVRTGQQIMEDFYSCVVPRIRGAAFGYLGVDVIIELEPTNKYTMTTVYHAVEEWSVVGIRSAIQNLLKSRILSDKMQNPCDYWCNLFWQHLYGKNSDYFCTDDEDFRSFKTSVFGVILPHIKSTKDS